LVVSKFVTTSLFTFSWFSVIVSHLEEKRGR